MAPLTQAEVDSLIKELSPLTTNEEWRTKLGVKLYDALFEAKPEYIKLFSKLQGFDKDTVKGSEELNHYGRTLTEELLSYVHAGSNDDELKKLIDNSAADHKKRNLSKDYLLGAEPLFIGVFNNILKEGTNKESMEKLFKHVMPAIGDQL